MESSFRSVLTESKKSSKLAKRIDAEMGKIDESYPVDEFARAVAEVLSEEFGSHNYDEFMKVLEENLKGK